MKLKYTYVGLCALIAISCSVEEVDQGTSIDIPDQLFYARMELPSGLESRVYADEDLSVLWDADDRVSIFNKYTYNQEYRFTGKTGANSGSFKKAESDDFVTGNTLNYVYSVYPYRESTSITNSGALILDLPSVQTYRANSFGIGVNTMVSCSEGNELLFKNLCGYVAISLYGDNVSVTEITFRGNNGEKIAGEATVTSSINNSPSLSLSTNATEVITLSFDNAIRLGTSAETATTFWLVVPPIVFSKGFSVTVLDNNNGSFEKATTKAFTVNRNTLSRMSALKVIPTASYVDEYGVNYGPGITIDGITWAPVNCGYKPETADSKGFPYGKLYQWGRISGQGYGYPYTSEDDSFADESSPNIENGWTYENGGEDPNSFYSPNGGYFDWDWIQDGNPKYWKEADGGKTQYDPCPLGWRVPTWKELETLYHGGHSSWTEYNGQKGIWFSGSQPYNGSSNKIFLPASGERYPYSGAQNRGEDGYYWSSSVVNYFSWSLKVDSGGPGKWYMGKAYGLSVRCVRETSPGEVYISSDYSLDGHVNLIQKATKGDGVNLIITGDAFSDKDQDLFIRYANLAKDAIFSEEPYTRMKDRFNVYAINAVSENGNVGGSTRFLTDFMGGSKIQGDISHIFAFIMERLPEIDLNKAPICIIVNDIRHAGYCNWWSSNKAMCFVPFCNDDASFSGTLLHEFGGHAFGKLLDEYNYSGTIPSSTVNERNSWRDFAYGFYANVDYTNDPSVVQWSHFLSDERYSGVVGIYEGADTYQYGAYRPSEESIMRHDKGGFNAPSREAIYYKIMKFSEGDQWEYDYETFVAFDKTAREIDANRVKGRRPSIFKNGEVGFQVPPEYYDNSISSGEALD